MTSSRSLPVIMPDLADQRWSCHSCGNCCRTLVGHLTEEERERIDRQGWAEKLGLAPYVKIPRGWALNKRDDGACVFLDDNMLCRIHAEFGEAAKPLACRIFPFSVRAVPEAWQAAIRFDCPSVVSSRGKPIGQYRDWLTQLAENLDHSAPRADDTALLQRGIQATTEEIAMVTGRFVRWLKEGGLSGEGAAIEDQGSDATVTPPPLSERERGLDERPALSLHERLIGCARITALLHGATFKRVRSARLAELLDLLFGALPSECAAIPEPSTPRQLAMVRQLAFAHAEHVTLHELRAGWLEGLRKRRAQLRAAKLFRKGVGVAPALPGFSGETSFEAVDAVGQPTDCVPGIEELLARYLAARLESRSTFGDGYYGWPVFSGLGALWASIAVVGWLARYAAALRGATAPLRDDVGHVLGIVDRAATRLPVLGGMVERMRVSYLFEDDGLARAIHRYVPMGAKRS